MRLLLSRIPPVEFGKFVLPGSIDILSYDPTAFRIRKTDGVFLEFLLILSLVLEQIEHQGSRPDQDSKYNCPTSNRVKTVNENENACDHD